MRKKKLSVKLGTILGISVLAIALLSGIVFSEDESLYKEQDYAVQKLAIETFELDTNKLKPLFLRDIFDDQIAKLPSETRDKIALCYSMLLQDKDLKEGDQKPVIFVENDDKVLIAIKHPDATISLTSFDISKEKPVKGEKQIKEEK